MIRWLWDLLFTRSVWKIIETKNLVDTDTDAKIPFGIRYVLQDQWGDIKKKDVH